MQPRTVKEVKEIVDQVYRELMSLGYCAIPEQEHKRYLTMMYTIGIEDRTGANSKAKRIELLSLRGTHIRYFISSTQASRVLGIHRKTLRDILNTDRSWRDFTFRSVNDDIKK